MNTYYLAALGTRPPFIFVSYKMSYAEHFYVIEIVNHTHTIFGSIALIQVAQPITRKTVATETVIGFTCRFLLTILNFASDAGFQFEAVVTSTARACLFIFYICSTKATVHSAWSDQCCAHCMCLLRSNLRHMGCRQSAAERTKGRCPL
jgi:hypothetical protein